MVGIRWWGGLEGTSREFEVGGGISSSIFYIPVPSVLSVSFQDGQSVPCSVPRGEGVEARTDVSNPQTVMSQGLPWAMRLQERLPGTHSLRAKRSRETGKGAGEGSF